MFEQKCLRCGHEWVSRSETPARCPASTCHSAFWDTAPGGPYRPPYAGHPAARKGSK